MALAPWQEALKKWLSSHHVRVSDLARQTGIPKSTLGDWISKELSPKGSARRIWLWREVILLATGIDMAEGERIISGSETSIPSVNKPESSEKQPAETRQEAPLSILAIPNFLTIDDVAGIMALGYGSLRTFLRFATKAEREEFRRNHPDIAFELGNLTAALASEEGYQTMLAKGKI